MEITIPPTNAEKYYKIVYQRHRESILEKSKQKTDLNRRRRYSKRQSIKKYYFIPPNETEEQKKIRVLDELAHANYIMKQLSCSSTFPKRIQIDSAEQTRLRKSEQGKQAKEIINTCRSTDNL